MQKFLAPRKATGKHHMLKSLIASVGLALSAATPAFASVEWDWQFNSPANPATPTFGDPSATATITLGAFGAGWHNDWSLGSATGYWDLGKNGTVVLTIPNLASPSRSHNAMLSIVQWIDAPLYTGSLTYSFSGATLLTSSTHLIQATSLGSWVEYDTLWNLLPSSNPEVITITAPLTGAIIDRITVVPEPTTVIAGVLLLLPFGASTLRVLRRGRFC